MYKVGDYVVDRVTGHVCRVVSIKPKIIRAFFHDWILIEDTTNYAILARNPSQLRPHNPNGGPNGGSGGVVSKVEKKAFDRVRKLLEVEKPRKAYIIKYQISTRGRQRNSRIHRIRNEHSEKQNKKEKDGSTEVKG